MTRLPGPLRAVGGVVRRTLLPEWTAVLRDLSVLRRDRDHLLDDVRVLREELRVRREELADLRAQVAVLDADLDESRRLSARVADVTDLVIEVVLPLHDRDVDISRLRPPDVEPD